MRVIALSSLKKFWEAGHADAEQPLKAWHDEAKKAAWDGPAAVRERYATASILADNRVVFNIHGNKYRLIVAIDYPRGIVYVKFIGTHAEYDKINAEEVQNK